MEQRKTLSIPLQARAPRASNYLEDASYPIRIGAVLDTARLHLTAVRVLMAVACILIFDIFFTTSLIAAEEGERGR